MDYKLTNQIISITKSLNEEERELFLNSGKGKTYYISLFKVVLKHLDSNDAKAEIEKEVKKLEGELDDIKQNLLKKLIEFVSKIEQDKNLDYFEIKTNIESVTALYSREQYELANELIGKTYKKLKKIKPDGTNYHLFLQYINQVVEIQSKRIDSVTRSLPNEFENKETIEWLNRLSKAAAHYITPSEMEVSSEFHSNLFFNLLLDYLFKKTEFRDLENLLNNSNQDSLFRIRTKNKDEETLFSFGILRDLFKLQVATRLNNPDDIEYILRSLENSASHFKEKHYQTFIFLIIQIFDFRINIGMDTNNFQLVKKEEDIYYTTKNDLKLFIDKDIEGVSLRLEVNKGLVFLFTGDYERAYKIFSTIPLPDKSEIELKYYIKLFELLAYRIFFKELNLDKFDKGLESLKNVKYEGSSYSKAFLKLLLKNADGKNLLKEGMEFLEHNTPTSTFDKISKYWLIQIQQRI